MSTLQDLYKEFVTKKICRSFDDTKILTFKKLNEEIIKFLYYLPIGKYSYEYGMVYFPPLLGQIKSDKKCNHKNCQETECINEFYINGYWTGIELIE